VNKGTLSILAALTVFLSGCSSSVKPPGRPGAVPTSAIWSGGADGGAWYDCSENRRSNVNECAIFSDEGKLWIRAQYKLKNQNRAATKEEFRHPWIDHIPDAKEIHLDDGKILIAVQVLYTAPD